VFDLYVVDIDLLRIFYSVSYWLSDSWADRRYF